MKVKVTPQIKDSINRFKNKTSITNGYKIYAALYLKSKYKNSKGYFPVPSMYLHHINARYNRFIKKFVEDGILDYFKRIEPGIAEAQDIVRRYYDSNKGICSKYKFLINIEDGEEMEIDFKSDYDSNWYKKIKSSLIELNYKNIKIKRDGFGLRVWHSAIPTYKKDLSGKGLMIIDARCSQPRLLYTLMKETCIVDVNFYGIFENRQNDFYYYLIQKFKISGDDARNYAKELFTMWIFGTGYTNGYDFYSLFPEASKFIRGLKFRGYKDASSIMQRHESSIWIDDIMNNIPLDFAIPIHDSIIVKTEDAFDALIWCRERHPEIDFTLKEL